MKRATARNTFPTSASAKDGLPAVCCHCGRTRSPHGVRPPLRALPRPLCRYESIILLAADTCLLTELSNVVAYPCRHSRAEDRQMTTPGQPLLLERPHLGLVRAGRAGEHGQVVACQDQL